MKILKFNYPLHGDGLPTDRIVYNPRYVRHPNNEFDNLNHKDCNYICGAVIIDKDSLTGEELTYAEQVIGEMSRKYFRTNADRQQWLKEKGVDDIIEYRTFQKSKGKDYRDVDAVTHLQAVQEQFVPKNYRIEGVGIHPVTKQQVHGAWGYDSNIESTGYFFQAWCVQPDGEDFLFCNEGFAEGISEGRMIELKQVWKVKESEN